MAENFEEVSDTISLLERKLYPSQEFTGEILIRKGVDFSPPEFNRLTYEDVLFSYERMNKVKKTAEKVMKFAPAARSKATEEVEQKIQAISRETTVFEFEKDFHYHPEAVVEKPVSVHEEHDHIVGEFDVPKSRIEKKQKPLELNIPRQVDEYIEEKEKPVAVAEPEPKTKYSAIVFESAVKQKEEKEALRVPLVTLTKEIPYISSHDSPVFPSLSLLSMKPQQYADQLYDAISGNVEISTETKADKASVKIKMLELTKLLFKEKSVHERDRIKKEIIQLKDMLVTSSPTGKKVSPQISQLALQAAEREQYELSTKLESVVLIELRKSVYKFSEALSMTDNNAKKEEEFDLLSEDIDAILKQFNELSTRAGEFLVSAHELLFEKIKEEDIEASEKAKITKVSTNLDDVYSDHFESLALLVKRYAEMLRAAGKSKAGLEKNKNLDILSELSEQKEEQLLNYLNVKAQTVYLKYSSKEISKLEAILRAIMLLAKEKGLSNELIDKYFKTE